MPGPSEDPAPDGRRLLVVDDNLDAAELLGEMLELFGFEVAVETHARAAIERARTFQPEYAVLDIGLPDMDGYALAAELRALLPELRLIALTGYGQEADRAKAERAGFDHHLVKPVATDKLLEALGVKS